MSSRPPRYVRDLICPRCSASMKLREDDYAECKNKLCGLVVKYSPKGGTK